MQIRRDLARWHTCPSFLGFCSQFVATGSNVGKSGKHFWILAVVPTWQTCMS
jgi:hypothetical protein